MLRLCEYLDQRSQLQSSVSSLIGLFPLSPQGNLVGVELLGLLQTTTINSRVAAGQLGHCVIYLFFLFLYLFLLFLRDGFEVNGGPCTVKRHPNKEEK